jgi:UDP-N-acetyl-2-amino-2-deoxyglucuronate dehydrogenase
MAAVRYALIGAAGYVAPRHMKAIKETGGELVSACDPNDSVGIIDSYFPDARFFVEFERFDRHIDKLRRRGDPVDFVSICSPNYLHDAHIRFALRSGANVICEKPMVLNPWNIDGLVEIESQSDCSINTILQLRLHPAIIALKKTVDAQPGRIHDIDLTYITSRGGWYQISWKGESAKSGGVATNIGVHFFDMLGFVFGKITFNIAHLRDPWRAAGYLEFERARVRWFLSIDRNDLPEKLESNSQTYRSMTVSDETVEFSAGFTDLHTESYKHILAGTGFGIEEVRPSIEIVSAIGAMDLEPQLGEQHPLTSRHLLDE